MKQILMALAAALLAAFAAQGADGEPALEFVMELDVEIGDAIAVGDVGSGQRTVIPIVGGAFAGPNIRGEVLSGGADYQVYDTGHRRNKLEAIYCIRTDDGESIMVKNRGIVTDGYFCASPVFEADYDGKYAWLNDGIYVCKPAEFAPGRVVLRVWLVK